MAIAGSHKLTPEHCPDSLSSTASIASSIYKFREENGRTYNGYGDRTYFMPNDLQHHLWQLTFRGKLFTAPIETTKLHGILDAGTGTGIWAIDIDSMPPNVKFEIGDLEKPWSFSQGFDFVFSRMMTGSFSSWKQYIDRCFE
ncbi:hypothetical protein BGZ57DRAFT_944876 [Hyaloscypha finlandica]|nr:hypothetical protein BGZ57DRAFT_944876 [Hyaloscypha finlandica]